MEYTTLEHVKELNHLSQQINDEDLDTALNILLKLIGKPDMPPQVIGPTIVQLQAIAAKLRIMAAVETHIYKQDRVRKNLLYTTSDSIDSLVQALKYLLR
jgi:hypothetical protein